MNLGSTVKDSTLPTEKLKELLATFRKLPMRVLWKWDGGVIENLPRNVMTLRWFPQYDILSKCYIFYIFKFHSPLCLKVKNLRKISQIYKLDFSTKE